MKIFYMGNNYVAWKILEWLKDSGEDIRGLAVHPEGKRNYVDELIAASGLDKDRIFDASTLNNEKIRASVKELGCDMALSILLSFILEPEFFNMFERGVVNLHSSYLPYNRGAHPNVWSIIEPPHKSGVTLHYIDDDIDTGDIISQEEVPIEPVDTGMTMYYKLEKACIKLFKDSWETIKKGQVQRKRQERADGSFHYVKDLSRHDRIDPDREYKARDLINIIRARTYFPYSGAYFEENGKKVYMRLQLMYEEDLKKYEAPGRDRD